ncbi:MAG TPA: hypothetical protein VNA25_20810 [Phycisphaerae bacterium]|nr:hypothetical protein [Phycisphaerae bacterium]
MSRNSDLLLQVLRDFNWVNAVWWDDPNDPHELHVSHTGPSIQHAIPLPNDLHSVRIISHPSEAIKILTCFPTAVDPANIHQACQDEPIQLGCQCQPEGANWLGTAGSPVSWSNPEGKRFWGVLSNWHVMAAGQERLGRNIHQPDVGRASFATLHDWRSVNPHEVNHFDAAIADAQIGDYHSISSTILELGPLCPTPLRATVGLDVCKSGRTTALTCATCSATGAAVRVGYGDFSAAFEDQDVFLAAGAAFSAPGDSGSLIVDRAEHCPVSLLFAGSSQLTIGNPIRYIVDDFKLSFNLR